MGTRYNGLARQNLERLAALGDGLFAVSMTLLMLDLKIAAAAIHSNRALLAALGDLALWPVIYLMSFLMLGIF